MVVQSINAGGDSSTSSWADHQPTLTRRSVVHLALQRWTRRGRRSSAAQRNFTHGLMDWTDEQPSITGTSGMLQSVDLFDPLTWQKSGRTDPKASWLTPTQRWVASCMPYSWSTPSLSSGLSNIPSTEEVDRRIEYDECLQKVVDSYDSFSIWDIWILICILKCYYTVRFW